ncbi:MAG: hypothetical protein HQ567_26030 [Candidatus Nealsonbacteria bacterium]|nr:hypothetical protein [Candidatus Nealsonbacteria bacterium]
MRKHLFLGPIVLVAAALAAPAADDSPPKPDWIAPLAGAEWTFHVDWLANPADEQHHRVDAADGVCRFRVTRPGRGMKWSWNLAEPVSLEQHRYVAIRYRTSGTRPHHDYAVCAIGKPRSGGIDYRALVHGSELIRDGRWHTLSVDLRGVAAELPTATALAVQVQSSAADGLLELSEIRLTDVVRATKLSDAVDFQSGTDWTDHRAVPIDSVATRQSNAAESDTWRQRLQLAGWFPEANVTIEGIPFALRRQRPDLAATPLGEKAELRLPVDAAATEVYLLLLAQFDGLDEPCYGGGKLTVIRDVDRFRIRLHYADGTVDECLPMNAATRQFCIGASVQVVVAAADPSKRLAAVVLCDRAKQAAFAVAGVTLRTGAARAFPEALEETPPLAAGWLAAERSEAPDRNASGAPLRFAPATLVDPVTSNLVKLNVDGKDIAADDVISVDASQERYKIRGIEGLRLQLSLRPVGEDSLAITATLHNDGPGPHKVTLIAPSVGPYRLGRRVEDAYYLFPKCGAVFDNRPCTLRERYGGRFPVQFVDTFNPADGRGLSLRTTDTTCLRKYYLLEKQSGQFTVGVEYPEQTLRPGERFTTAEALITTTDGDWHHALVAYRNWLGEWARPVSPRKPWFREVFNFRQRFLWSYDPLYDAKQGTLHLDRAVDEARREFGGIDYLHLFDWGNCGPLGRIYGRTGDHLRFTHIVFAWRRGSRRA